MAPAESGGQGENKGSSVAFRGDRPGEHQGKLKLPPSCPGTVGDTFSGFCFIEGVTREEGKPGARICCHMWPLGSAAALFVLVSLCFRLGEPAVDPRSPWQGCLSPAESQCLGRSSPTR